MTYTELFNKLYEIASKYELRLCIEKPCRGHGFYLYFVDEVTHRLSKDILWFPEKDEPTELLEKLENLAFTFKGFGYGNDGIVS